ncbi:hypothetical protein GOP47_0018573 [Adiantum capillus-veneris]|uniref:C2 domain-containing protein n=1 Tax=Adiantum capillus-veneris TaxID=13818 RepID=A0A9D4Z8X0_ADICA|nr:hypothetical protein GOP47_0018573 [Adiantum capillus-veneris]
MGAIKGILKVRVVQGTDLAVRDVYSSDPYVKLRVGDHQVKTRVIPHNLNPRWNEELTLATADPPQPLKLFVYDKDMFTADDKMGEAQIDLNPLISTVKLNESHDCQEGVIISYVAATSENGFTKDSAIKIKKSRIVQKICIRLKNVESGEIKLELMWQPCSQ